MNTKRCDYEKILDAIAASRERYRVGRQTVRAILWGPFVVFGIFSVGLLLPPTRDGFLWLVRENRPIETLTFLALMAGGLLGLRLAWRERKGGEGFPVVGFLAVFSAGLVFIALEEIAWGQNWFGFETPAILEANEQGEVTLHNLPGLQGRSEFMRLAFGAGGIVGVMLGFSSAFRRISVPAVLLPLFVLITGHAAIDVVNDFASFGEKWDDDVQRSSEVIELFIGVAGLLYVWLLGREPEHRHR